MKSNWILLLCLFSLNLWAGDGGWISSGGESFHDAKNPWFLAGAEVSYCLVVDDATFELDAQTIESNVVAAIDYWQREFSKQSGPVLGHKRKSFKLGNNTFHKTNASGCSGSEDLRFIFGSGSLREDERKFLTGGQQNFVGVAVRTDYDSKNLRGKGFIYLASGKDIESSVLSSDTVKKPWASAKLLKLALIHELGHVFGIPHMGSSLMSEVFMDILLSKYYSQDFIKLKVESFVSSEREIKRCAFITPEMINFFGLKLNTSCLKIVWVDAKSFDVYSSTFDQEPILVAKAVSLEVDFFGIESRPISFLRLTKEQTVFDWSAIDNRSLVAGPLQERFNMKGKIIILKDMKSLPVQISLSPESFTMNSILNGKIVTTFSYDSPFSSILGQTLDIKL